MIHWPSPTACRRLALKEPVEGTARLFSESITGLLVELPGWRYPIVIDTTGGTVRYDNYGERWGSSGTSSGSPKSTP